MGKKKKAESAPVTANPITDVSSMQVQLLNWLDEAATHTRLIPENARKMIRAQRRYWEHATSQQLSDLLNAYNDI